MRTFIIKAFPIIRIIFYIAFFTFFIIIPISHFKESTCITYTKLNYICPTCGVTRAFISIMSFDFKAALDFNTVFTLAIAPISIFIFIQDAYTIIKRNITKKKKHSIIEYFFVDYLK